MEAAAKEKELAILILAPFGRDAELAVKYLERRGFHCIRYDTVALLLERLEKSMEAGMAIIAQEALEEPGSDRLIELLAQQPNWSDLPVLILTRENRGPDRLHTMASVRGVSLIARPLEFSSFLGMVQTGLGARRRQYEVRRLLEEADRLNVQLQQRVEQLAQLAAQLTRTEHLERKRLAKILHDHIQQLIVAARMQLGWLGENRNLEEVQASARQADSVLQEALDASRNLTLDLSPPVLYEAGLVGGLNWLAANIAKKHQFQVDLQAEKEAEPVLEELRILFFECAREALLNAIKHSGVSAAQVSLTRTPDDQIQLVISDKGQGFDPEVLRNRRTEDVTFGLFSIQERLIHVGGRMEIESAPGRGTRLTLTVPEARVVETVEKIAQTPAASGAKETVTFQRKSNLCRVLIVDDHKIMREGLVKLFRLQSDIEVVGGAADGREAIEKADQLRPDVVIMDVTLGAMSGIEATRQILQRHPESKVIGLSMHRDPSVVEAMHQAGATAYLTKSGPSDELIAAVRKHCGPTQPP